jgi:hypothetical protein
MTYKIANALPVIPSELFMHDGIRNCICYYVERIFTLTHYGANMSKLRKIQNEFWWVPENSPTSLAVQIADTEDYHQAIEWKMETLIEAEGLESAIQTVALTLTEVESIAFLRDQRLIPAKTPEALVRFLLNQVDVSEMIRQGSPDRSEAADQATAEEAVQEQSELTLSDFLS